MTGDRKIDAKNTDKLTKDDGNERGTQRTLIGRQGTAVHEPSAKYYQVCMEDGGAIGQKLGCG